MATAGRRSTWDLLSKVPVVSALLGSVAGLPAINACMAHFNVMVKGVSQLFPGGPPVVKAALGYDIAKEDLGGPHIHTRVSGCVDNLADTEADAFEQIRRFLSYLPGSVWELAPRLATDDDPERRGESLLAIIPKDRRQVHKVRSIIDTVFDHGSFFAYRREIEAAADPDAKRREIEARLNAVASPFRTAEATGQDIIDPRDTRPLLCEFAEDAQRVLRTQLGEPPIPYRP